VRSDPRRMLRVFFLGPIQPWRVRDLNAHSYTCAHIDRENRNMLGLGTLTATIR